MKENLKLGLILCLITSFSGGLLGVANEFTKEVIAQNAKLSPDDLKEILPAAKKIEDFSFEKKEESSIKEVFKAEDKGHVIKVSPKGFNGPIDMVVAINNNKEISGVKVLAQAETPGLGAKVSEKDFYEKFKGLPIEEDIKIVKNSPSDKGEIQGITGATISSNAILSGINEAVNFYKENILGEDLSKEKVLDLSKINLDGEIQELSISLEEGIDKVYIVSKGGEDIGYAIEGNSIGMYEEKPIRFALGISSSGIVTGLQIIDHKETAGLGDLIEEESFLNSFVGLSVLDKLKVKENTQEIDLSAYGEVVDVDAISGATKSSMAVIKGVTNVINFYNSNLK